MLRWENNQQRRWMLINVKSLIVFLKHLLLHIPCNLLSSYTFYPFTATFDHRFMLSGIKGIWTFYSSKSLKGHTGTGPLMLSVYREHLSVFCFRILRLITDVNIVTHVKNFYKCFLLDGVVKKNNNMRIKPALLAYDI